METNIEKLSEYFDLPANKLLEAINNISKEDKILIDAVNNIKTSSFEEFKKYLESK